MYRHAALLCLLLGSMMLLCACQHSPPASPVSVSPPVPGSALASFSFSESGSFFKRVQGYEYRAEDGRHTAYFHMANEEELYPVPVDQVWVDTLNSFIARYGMTRWDGFSGSAPGLLDGTQFYVEFTLSDGTNVKAGGYGDFPDGYGGASKAIDTHFLQLLPEDMRDW